MVFITAGMGGGTGTGAGPIVAQVAKEMGILTVGVISKPFDFEGAKRAKVAEAGAHELENYVDSLIVVLNEKLFEVMGEDAEMDKAFGCADDVLHNAVAGIAEIINEQGLAAEAAVASPLLEGVDLSGARGVLVNITASRSLKLSETREVMGAIRGYAADDATVIFGTVYDESLGDALRVTVVATGLNGGKRKEKQPEVIWRNTQATGTYDAMPTMADLSSFAPQSATASMAMANTAVAPTPAMPASSAADYAKYDVPKVFRSNRESAEPRLGANSSPEAQAMMDKGADYYDIPAFLRKQAD
jgi:cell division protein FtsZ